MSAASAGGEPPSSDKPDNYQNLDGVDQTTPVKETFHVPKPPPCCRHPRPFGKRSIAEIERKERKHRRARRLKQAESRRLFRFETYGSFVQLRYGKDAVVEYTRGSFWAKQYDPVRRQYDWRIDPSGSKRNLLDWMDDFSSDCELCPPAERRRVREPIPPPVPFYEWAYSSSSESDEKRELDDADRNNETNTGEGHQQNAPLTGSETETSYENTKTKVDIDDRKTRDWSQRTDALNSAPETTQRPTIWRRKYVQLPDGNESAQKTTWLYTGGKASMSILRFETMMDRVRMKEASIVAVHDRGTLEKNIKNHTPFVRADFERKRDACNDDHGGESRSAGIEEQRREVGEGVHGGGDVFQLEHCDSDEETDDVTNRSVY